MGVTIGLGRILSLILLAGSHRFPPRCPGCTRLRGAVSGASRLRGAVSGRVAADARWTGCARLCTQIRARKYAHKYMPCKRAQRL